MKSFLIISVLVLAGCTTLPKQENWPAEIPPYDYFVGQYQSDVGNRKEQSLNAYLGWVKNFYDGFLVGNRGWLAISQEAEEMIDDPEKQQSVEEKLYLLGKKISAEWSKSKKHQRINTRLLGIWGASLQEAIDRDEPLEYIDSVESDVDALLLGDLKKEEIENYRYFPESDSFFF